MTNRRFTTPHCWWPQRMDINSLQGTERTVERMFLTRQVNYVLVIAIIYLFYYYYYYLFILLLLVLLL